jgi:hypothetical protein
VVVEMGLPWLKEVYRRLQRPVIYLILLTIIIIQILSYFLKPIQDFLSPEGATFLIFVILLLIFHHMDDRFENLSILSSLKYCDDFNNAMSEILGDSNQIGQIDFIGLTGGLFQPAIWSRRVKINKMRVLLRNPDLATNSKTLHLPTYQEYLKKNTMSSIMNFRILEKDGYVEKLEIKVYNFESTIFAIIIDRKKGFWGFFKPKSSYPYFDVMKCLLLTQNSSYEKALLNDLIEWYDQIFENIAQPL